MLEESNHLTTRSFGLSAAGSSGGRVPLKSENNLAAMIPGRIARRAMLLDLAQVRTSFLPQLPQRRAVNRRKGVLGAPKRVQLDLKMS